MKESYKKKWLMPALSCAVIAMTGQSKAQVIVEFEQIGNDVVATWSGIINLSSSSGSSQANHTEASATVLVTRFGPFDVYPGTASNVIGFGGSIDSTVGGTFGFGDGFFFVPRGSLSGLTVDYDASTYSMTFAQDTLANIGADSFNNTLAWTSQAGGNNTISYTTVGFVVPEPSSSLLVGLGALGLMVRRRR